METVQEKFKWLERQHAKRPFMNKMECKARLIEYHFDPHRKTIHQYLINFAKKKHDLLSMGKGLSVDEEREILLCNTRKYLNLSSHYPGDQLETKSLLDITFTFSRNTRTREMHGNLERVNLKYISRRLNGDRNQALGIINEIIHGVKRPVIGVIHQNLNVLDVVAWAIIKVIAQEAAQLVDAMGEALTTPKVKDLLLGVSEE
ncbi:hypothetical protein Ae201684P_017044 [Aphanomyces euteiches]|nr:hypothetical protein Ae201684P_004203 [Aphanomyces euteiches]KAH9094437.1 hypothetical protein Ae201684P_017044 [Aphanomyces euteiches]